METDKTITLR